MAISTPAICSWDQGHLSAVVDFGDLTAGHPATDLAVMWMLLPRQVWPAATEPHTDRDLMLRARGWAVVLGLAFLANSRDDAKMNAVGMATVNATLRN